MRPLFLSIIRLKTEILSARASYLTDELKQERRYLQSIELRESEPEVERGQLCSRVFLFLFLLSLFRENGRTQ